LEAPRKKYDASFAPSGPTWFWANLALLGHEDPGKLPGFLLRSPDVTLMIECRVDGSVSNSGILMPNEIRTAEAVQDDRRARLMAGFDYDAPAELFPSRIKKNTARMRYMRFDTAAEAVRFAVEDIAPPALLGAYLEVDETRFGIQEIHALYESPAFPLKRAEAKKD
jgi:hypothetical protein